MFGVRKTLAFGWQVGTLAILILMAAATDSRAAPMSALEPRSTDAPKLDEFDAAVPSPVQNLDDLYELRLTPSPRPAASPNELQPQLFALLANPERLNFADAWDSAAGLARFAIHDLLQTGWTTVAGTLTAADPGILGGMGRLPGLSYGKPAWPGSAAASSASPPADRRATDLSEPAGLTLWLSLFLTCLGLHRWGSRLQEPRWLQALQWPWPQRPRRETRRRSSMMSPQPPR